MAPMHTRLLVLALGGLALMAALLSQANAGDKAVDPVAKEVTLALSTEPPSLNTVRATDSISFMVLDHIIEGLMRYDGQGKLVGGVAERWQLNANSATFWLRPDAKWSDGKPVTAHDFAFAWRQLVNPKSGAEYAYIMYPVKNAEKVNKGELPLEALGVKALDDHTLQVELEQPCPYFLDLTAFISYRPIRQDFYQAKGERYAADAGDLLFNGPFKLASWVHGASLRLEKNPDYWRAAEVQLNALDLRYITSDPNAVINLFYDGRIALAGLDTNTIPEALKRRLSIRQFQDGGIIYLEFNHRPGRPTANRALRKAIQEVYNANELVNKVVAVPGTLPTYTLFPKWTPGEQAPFREEHPPQQPGLDLARARAYVEQAKRELGVDEIPPLSLLISEGPQAVKQAEYLQSTLSRQLGLTLKIDTQTFKQRLAKMGSGDFDLVGAGWSPDYSDAMTFADLFASWSENNRGRYKSEAYDRQVRIAQASTDPAVRVAAFAELQRLIFEDAVILPQYERGGVYVQSPQLEGVSRRIFGGDPNFSYARIVP